MYRNFRKRIVGIEASINLKELTKLTNEEMIEIYFSSRSRVDTIKKLNLCEFRSIFVEKISIMRRLCY